MPVIFNPFGFSLYAPIRAWFLYTSTAAISLFWLAGLFQQKKIFLRRNPLERPLLFFIAVLLVSTLFSVHIYSSIFGHYLRYEGLLAWLSYLALFLLATQLFTEKKDIERLLKYLALAAIFISLYAIAQHFGWDVITWQAGLTTKRSFSTLGNPAYLGAYLALLLPLFINFAFFDNARETNRWLYALAAALMAVALTFTLTRGAWLAVMFSLILMAVLRRRTIKKSLSRTERPLLKALLIILIISLSLLPLKSYAGNYIDRLTSLVKGEGSVSGRVLIWKQVLPLIVRRPIVGSGLDTLYLTFSTQITPEYERRIVRDTATDRAHNDLLQMAATTGLLGLLSYLALLTGFMLISFKALAKAQGYWRVLIEGIVLGAVSYLIMLQTHFSTIDVSPIFWVLLGVGLAASQKFIKTKPPKLIIKSLNPRVKLAALLFAITFTLAIGWFSFKPVAADYYYKQAKVAEKIDLPEAAIDRYHLSTKWDSGNDYYWGELSNAYITLAPKVKNPAYFNAGVTAARQATKLSPLNEYNYSTLGSAYLAAFEYSGDKGELKSAIAAFKEGKRIDANYADMRFKLGLAYVYDGKNQSAVKEWRKVIELAPKAISARINLAKLYEQLGQSNRAASYYRQVLIIDPKNEPAKQALSALNGNQILP